MSKRLDLDSRMRDLPHGYFVAHYGSGWAGYRREKRKIRGLKYDWITLMTGEFASPTMACVSLLDTIERLQKKHKPKKSSEKSKV